MFATYDSIRCSLSFKLKQLMVQKKQLMLQPTRLLKLDNARPR
jgi:hypothetical protein